MNHKWITREGNSKLILFFNGWGMNESVIAHIMSSNADVVMFHNYHKEPGFFPQVVDGYNEIFIVAWSFGVAEANRVFSEFNFVPAKTIALNGSQIPISDTMGIPNNIFDGTMTGLSDNSLRKFNMRICGGREGFDRFESIVGQADLEELANELRYFKSTYNDDIVRNSWDCVYVSREDRIFPFDNLIESWKGFGNVIVTDWPHMPFWRVDNWSEILGDE